MEKTIKPKNLNYTRYSDAKYDGDIIRSIPGHRELHKKMLQILKYFASRDAELHILDLGVGTGITSAQIQKLFPKARLDVVDFSEAMLKGAKRKLGTENVRYFARDYSSWMPRQKYDAIVSVIGFHHQPNREKTIQRVAALLRPGGIFMLGDLMTDDNVYKTSVDTARHFHHLVENAADEKSLSEWAHHHLYLNKLTSSKTHLDWLKESGFMAKMVFRKNLTTLLLAHRPLEKK
jgi:tRNA (cmo5U34)-methyltransferase